MTKIDQAYKYFQREILSLRKNTGISLNTLETLKVLAKLSNYYIELYFTLHPIPEEINTPNNNNNNQPQKEG